MAATSAASPATTALSTRLIAGVAGGLAGGAVFGALMQMMGMLPMVAMLVGSESVAVGWVVHLAISAFIGITYALIFGRRAAATLATLAGPQRRLGVGPRSVQVALTHDQLAALVGTTRETATKVLGEFADRGLLRRGRGRIILLDIDGLGAEAGD